MRVSAAALLVARVELRRRLGALLALGALAGLAGALATGAAVLQRRTSSAYERLDAVTALDDARVLASRAAVGDITRLPVVSSAWAPGTWVGQVAGPSVQFLSVSAGPMPPEGLFRPVLLSGRAPDPRNPHEILLAEPLAGFTGLGPGSTIELKLLTAAEVEQFDTGFGEPDGPRVTLTVTGVGRLSTWGSGLGYAIATPAFGESYAATEAGATVLLRLHPGADSRAALTAGLDRLTAGTAGPSQSDFGPLRATFPRQEVAPAVVMARRVLSVGVGTVAVGALLGGLLIVGQALGRHHAATSGDQRVEAALGMTTGERVLARVLPALPAAALAAALAMGGGLLAGRLEPLGAMRRYEPDPGWRLDPAAVSAGTLATGLLLLALAATTAALAGSSRRRSAPPTALRSLSLLRRPASLAGAAFALDRGRAPGTLPVRAGAVGVALAVAGVVAAATFAAGLDRLVTTPARYGWNADFAVVDAKEPDVARLLADARVAAVDVVGQSQVRAPDGFAAAYSFVHRKGTLPWTVVTGRLPEHGGEVALGPVLVDRWRTTVGAETKLVAADGRERTVRVVGVVVAPPGDAPLGAAAVFTPDGLAGLAQGTPFVSAYVRAVAGQSGPLLAELSTRHELTRAAPPAEVATLADLRRLPRLLGGFLGVLGVAGLAHPVMLLVRRRRRDIGVLRALGCTGRQIAGSVLVAALTTMGLGLAVGLPLGLAAGRLVWAEAARAAGVAADMAVPGQELALVVAVATLVVLGVAAGPCRRATRIPAAGALRTE